MTGNHEVALVLRSADTQWNTASTHGAHDDALDRLLTLHRIAYLSQPVPTVSPSGRAAAVVLTALPLAAAVLLPLATVAVWVATLVTT